jgi:hypothetical protein
VVETLYYDLVTLLHNPPWLDIERRMMEQSASLDFVDSEKF